MQNIIGYLQSLISGHIISKSLNYQGDKLPEGFIFLDEDTHPRKDYICVATHRTLASLAVNGNQLQGAYIFVGDDCSEGSGGLTDGEWRVLLCAPNVTVFVTDLRYTTLFNRLRDGLARMRDTQPTHIAGKDSFAEFLYDVISDRLEHETEIATRLQRFPHVNNSPYRLIYLRFEREHDTTDNHALVLASLARLFAWSNATNYFGSIICIAQSPEGEPDSIALTPEKASELNAVCKRYHCYCCVSNQTKDWVRIKTNFLTASMLLPLVVQMRRCDDERVFASEPNYLYLTLSMCYREFEHIYGHGNYIYMLHPGIARLIRYDGEHGTDLRKLFYAFLLNECNYTKTAKYVSMHRNTTIYNLRKAEEVARTDLSDLKVRFRLLWSCMFCEFCEKALGVPPTTFPGYLS